MDLPVKQLVGFVRNATIELSNTNSFYTYMRRVNIEPLNT